MNTNKNTAAQKEIGYEDVKAMCFYFFDTLSRLSMGKFTPEQIAARQEKGQACTLMQAIAEVIAPGNNFGGSYRCYSQRAFDQGNAGDPYEYTGVEFSFTLKDGIQITINTKYGNIRARYYSFKYDLGMGPKLMKDLDDLGMALWQDWDDNPQTLSAKLDQIDREETYMAARERDYMYCSSDRDSDFQQDVAGGIKYTSREEDPYAGRYFRYQSYDFYMEEVKKYREALAEEKAKEARKQYRVLKPGTPNITWENMTHDQRNAALLAYYQKKAALV